MSKKRKTRWLRYRKDDLVHNVFVALQRYIHANKGTAVVMGGVEVITIPGDPEFKYHIGLSIVGKRPEKRGSVPSSPATTKEK